MARNSERVQDGDSAPPSSLPILALLWYCPVSGRQNKTAAHHGQDSGRRPRFARCDAHRAVEARTRGQSLPHRRTGVLPRMPRRLRSSLSPQRHLLLLATDGGTDRGPAAGAAGGVAGPADQRARRPRRGAHHGRRAGGRVADSVHRKQRPGCRRRVLCQSADPGRAPVPGRTQCRHLHRLCLYRRPGHRLADTGCRRTCISAGRPISVAHGWRERSPTRWRR